jgi:hypothetical protein
MNITNKAISTKFLNIISRTNHVHTEIIIQYGGLRSSVTCVTSSCSNVSFASPTHRTNQSYLSSCPFCYSETLITSFNMTMQDVTWLVFVKTFLTRITSEFFFGRHNHQLNIYGMNSVDVFASQNLPENYRLYI